MSLVEWLGGIDGVGYCSIFDCKRDSGVFVGCYGICYEGECYDDFEVSYGFYFFCCWFVLLYVGMCCNCDVNEKGVSNYLFLCFRLCYSLLDGV